VAKNTGMKLIKYKEQLRGLRSHLGISMREVEEHSRRIAQAEDNQEYYVSNAWLTQLEKGESVPSIYKLYSLSVIYRVKFTALLQLFGVDLENITKHQLETPLQKTHLANAGVYDSARPVAFPIQFDRGFNLSRTGLLSRLVELWGEVPISFLQHLDLKTSQYGYIGMDDYTMYPLLRPGSFVQIDAATKISTTQWRTEFERPIYLLELREGYACSWCDLEGEELTLVPHPLSHCRTKRFKYPGEIDLLGRVTGVAMRIIPREPEVTPKLPK